MAFGFGKMRETGWDAERKRADQRESVVLFALFANIVIGFAMIVWGIFTGGMVGAIVSFSALVVMPVVWFLLSQIDIYEDSEATRKLLDHVVRRDFDSHSSHCGNINVTVSCSQH